ADSKRVYVGTENGGFFRSLDGGNTWSPNMAGPELPGVIITRLESSPTNADVLFATVANFGNSHVFRSDDGGAHWHDVDGGRLPDVPHHAAWFRRTNRRQFSWPTMPGSTCRAILAPPGTT